MTEYFRGSFISFVINEWDKFKPKIINSISYLIFRKRLINFIRPSDNKIFNIHDRVGIKLLTRLRLAFSPLRKHICRHNFEDIINPLCSCSIELETTMHFFIGCVFSLPLVFGEKLPDIQIYGNGRFDTKLLYIEETKTKLSCFLIVYFTSMYFNCLVKENCFKA